MRHRSHEEIDHTADWALRVRGRDMSELCLVAASAMLAACGALPLQGPSAVQRVDLRADDREGLLVAWLEEILYTLEVHHRLPTRIEVSVSEQLELTGRWTEAPLGQIEKPIKAVTYNDLAVRASQAGLEATIVFDV
jgi:SHS2 domain-containing protein